MLKTIYIVSTCIAVTAPVWGPYLLGLGGHERLVMMGMQFVFVIMVATGGVFVLSLFRLVASLIGHRPCKCIGRLFFAFVVICLSVVLPQFVAVNSRRLGAAHGLKRAGGDVAYAQLMDAARFLLSQSAREVVAPRENPQIFKRMGVKHITTHEESPAFIDAATSGRPFRTGWLIYPNVDAPPATKGVKVRPGLYRY
jgi:hypothetical protein